MSDVTIRNADRDKQQSSPYFQANNNNRSTSGSGRSGVVGNYNNLIQSFNYDEDPIN